MDLRGTNTRTQYPLGQPGNNNWRRIRLALTKNDSGLWELSGNNSGMSGTVTVAAGVLVLTSNNAIGTGTLTPGNAAIEGVAGTDLTFSNPVIGDQ